MDHPPYPVACTVWAAADLLWDGLFSAGLFPPRRFQPPISGYLPPCPRLASHARQQINTGPGRHGNHLLVFCLRWVVKFSHANS